MNTNSATIRSTVSYTNHIVNTSVNCNLVNTKQNHLQIISPMKQQHENRINGGSTQKWSNSLNMAKLLDSVWWWSQQAILFIVFLVQTIKYCIKIEATDHHPAHEIIIIVFVQRTWGFPSIVIFFQPPSLLRVYAYVRVRCTLAADTRVKW